jgi:hypothetical protein
MRAVSYRIADQKTAIVCSGMGSLNLKCLFSRDSTLRLICMVVVHKEIHSCIPIATPSFPSLRFVYLCIDK